jgi:predicted nuclease of predicted toxin-antitoxin system
LADKRFWLGYPPRKPKDTSIGDAINWEWMIACVRATGRDLCIVTRDTDFGISIDGQAVLNDWLIDEFAERTGGKSVLLTPKLADAFKAIAVDVTNDEVAAEDALIAARPSDSTLASLALAAGEGLSSQLLRSYNANYANQLSALLAQGVAIQGSEELPVVPREEAASGS